MTATHLILHLATLGLVFALVLQMIRVHRAMKRLHAQEIARSILDAEIVYDPPIPPDAPRRHRPF